MKFTAYSTALFTLLTALPTVFAGTAYDPILPSKTNLNTFCVLQAKEHGIPPAAAEKYVWSGGKCVDPEDADLEQRCQPLIKEALQAYITHTKASAYPKSRFVNNYDKGAQFGKAPTKPPADGYPKTSQFSIFCNGGSEGQCLQNCENLCGHYDDGCEAAKLGCRANCWIFC